MARGYKKHDDLVVSKRSYKPQDSHEKEEASNYTNADQNLDVGVVIGQGASSHHQSNQEQRYALEMIE